MSKIIHPYYSREGIRIYCCDCNLILPHLNPELKFLVTDPPYGIKLATNNTKKMSSNDYCGRNNYAPIYGDDKAFDPKQLLKFPQIVVFGANNFADRLPNSKGWIVWDKTGNGMLVNNKGQSDCELAWTNVTGGVRIFNQVWKGIIKVGSGENGQAKVHPTQKPVVLFKWILENWGWKDQETILDPYLGSGSCLVACAELGFKAIGIEIVEDYCKIAAERVDKAISARLEREKTNS